MKFIINNKVLSKFIYDDNHNFKETTLTIPTGVEEIETGADDEVILRQYKTLVLPASLKIIEDGAMIQFRKLENIILEEGSKFHYINGCLYSPDMKCLILSVNGIEHIDVAEGCNKIYEGAFIFKDIKSINMPNTITNIGKRCFLLCYNLSRITLSNKLTEIPFGAFTNCDNLKELFIPNSVNKIENDAIPKTTNLVFHAGSIAEEYAKKNSMNFTKLLY